MLFSLGYGPGHDANLMRQIADINQGFYNWVKDVNDVNIFFSDYTEICRELEGVNASVTITCLSNDEYYTGLEVTNLFGNAELILNKNVIQIN